MMTSPTRDRARSRASGPQESPARQPRLLRALRLLSLTGFMATGLAACEGSAESGVAAMQPPRGAGPVLLGLGGDEGGQAGADTIDLRTIGYSLGDVNAPVLVYEFSDFGCTFCRSFARHTFPEIYQEFVVSGQVRWTYVPFVMGMFPNAGEAARSAECAAEQGEFWAMHDELYEHQNAWKSTRSARPMFTDFAESIAIDPDQFATCYAEDRGGARTQLANYVANAMRVRATPTFFVNGRRLEGALPEREFHTLLRRLVEVENSLGGL